MEARDGDVPPRSAQTDVIVTVDRNLHAPVMTKPSAPEHRAEISVKETVGFDAVLYKFEGRDEDNRVSQHRRLAWSAEASAPTSCVLS